MSQSAKHVVFAGQVQGVGFRFTVFSIANRCNIKGIVRNLPDGSVEMIAQGENEDINDCIRDINDSFTGYISETKITEAATNPEYTDFKITF